MDRDRHFDRPLGADVDELIDIGIATVVDRIDGAGPDDFAFIDHRDLIGDLAHRRHVVGDRNCRDAEVARRVRLLRNQGMERRYANEVAGLNNRMTEVEVMRFPNQLCTDKGRAIIQQEPGWEQTLTGMPKEIYHVWHKHFRPRGYRLRVQIIDFPGGMPGDVVVTLSWE